MAAGVGLYLANRDSGPEPETAGAGAPKKAPPAAPELQAPKVAAFDDPRFPPLPREEVMIQSDKEIELKPDFRFWRLEDGRSVMTEPYETMKKVHTDALQPIEDIEALESIVYLYRWAYKTNPEGGSNREITAALMGDNPKRLVFIPPNHPNIDAEGQLLDRWGEPYKFHKISDQIMDILSSGPDRRLWTEDDLDLGHTREFQESSVAAE